MFSECSYEDDDEDEDLDEYSHQVVAARELKQLGETTSPARIGIQHERGDGRDMSGDSAGDPETPSEPDDVSGMQGSGQEGDEQEGDEQEGGNVGRYQDPLISGPDLDIYSDSAAENQYAARGCQPPSSVALR